MSRLACTTPNHLSMPRSSIAGESALCDTSRSAMRHSYTPLRAAALPPQSWGEAGRKRASSPLRPSEGGEAPSELLRHVVGDLDLAGDDVGARLLQASFHVRGHEQSVVLVDGIADAVLGDAQRADTRLPEAFSHSLERLVHREIDPLDHRGQDRARMDVVLVRGGPDRQSSLVLGGLEHAEPGGAGRGKDDVGAPIELAPRELAPARRVVPGGRRRAGHVLEDFDLRVDVLRAFFVAEREAADQRDVHAADEADLAGLRCHRCGHADQERSLVLLEDDRRHVGQVDDGVHDREFHVRELLGDLLQAARLGEADADDDLGAPARHVAERLLALGLGGHLNLAIRDPGFLLESLRAVVRRLVERLVELAAHVEHHGGRELLGRDGAGQGHRDEDGHRGAQRLRTCHVRAPDCRSDLAGDRRAPMIYDLAPGAGTTGVRARLALTSRAALFSCGMATVPSIYMASPLGFSEAGRHFYNSVLVPFVKRLGYEVLDPWALGDRARIEAVQRLPYGIEKREAWRTLNREIGATNRAAIDQAHGVIAVLDGVDVDSGTAAEIGYAFARGKLIVGYRGDFRLSADNEGSTVNLQVEFFIRESGGAIVSRYEDLEAHLRPLRATPR